VGFSWAHWCEDGPVPQSGQPPAAEPTLLYHEAQKIDEWPGENYDGTSVRAGAKILQTWGYLQSYYWAQSINDIVQALLEKGPVVVGTNWYSSMFDPNSKGILSISGQIAGGHAYVLNGINTKLGLVRMKNSWGRGWGINGRAYLKIEDVARLLNEAGEACLATEVTK
jgi:hypothetical protein